ncbi:MAG: ABC transporter permease subunit [Betaproteobacteria bacterium]|nr:MAG: ABC transporter permease subunit [Betaproteobacteria bacterium]
MFLRWVTALYLVYLVVPIALLLVGSFGELWLNTLLPAGATVRWYEAVATDPSFQRAFVSSLAVATLTCAANAVIGLPLAYALFRTDNKRVRALTRVLYQLPVALPALVLAFGFIAVIADMRRLGLRTLEDAAESLGGNGWQRFVHIVLPALRHSILAGFIIVAALSIGEFQFSNLIAGFLNRTYPVVLLQAFYGATGFACAATVILLALALLAAIAGGFAAGGATRVQAALA